MVTIDTIFDDIVCGVPEAELVTDVEVLRARLALEAAAGSPLEVDDQGAVRLEVGIDDPATSTNTAYPRHG